MKTVVIDTITYLIGTCAADNTQLVKDSDPCWFWFHLEKFPSCHVVACLQECTDLEIANAASLVKTHSKYKFKHIGVHYTTISNLSHCDKPGSVSFISKRKVKTVSV